MRHLPLLITLFAAAFLIWKAVPPGAPAEGPDFRAFGSLPVVSGGRIKPLDTVARYALLETSGRTQFKVRDEDGEVLRSGHNAWLAEVLFSSREAGTRPVILVENEEVKALFDRQADPEKRFSMADIGPFSDEIERLARAAFNKPADHRNVFERQLTALYQRITVIGQLYHAIQPPGLRDYTELVRGLPPLVESAVPETIRMQAGEEHDTAILARLADILHAFREVQRLHAFYPIPPRDPEEGLYGWSDIGSVILEDVARGRPHPAVDAWTRIADAYRMIPVDNGAAFNAEVNAYRQWLATSGHQRLRHAKVESWFNSFSPFYVSMQLYVLAFLMVLAFWMVGHTSLRDAAFRLLVLTFFVHTLGLAIRIWLSGRPPVTNLYSSAIFVGWGVLALCLLLERGFLKNGIASAAAATSGFCSLLVAHHLSFGGDTLEVKMAVLDSNFWLATHVVVVTLGYCACFLAGFLAIVWLVLGYARARFFDAAARKALLGAVYGVLCFGLLFSFTGTVLGGIWADQSWGRFWGWDPKENGALLIVLWIAIILHARWGGLIKEKGIMVMAMGANIITAWSWFGTNMLGIGLHSYGFMDEAFKPLIGFGIVNLMLMLLARWVPPPRKDTPAAQAPIPTQVASS